MAQQLWSTRARSGHSWGMCFQWIASGWDRAQTIGMLRIKADALEASEGGDEDGGDEGVPGSFMLMRMTTC